MNAMPYSCSTKTEAHIYIILWDVALHIYMINGDYEYTTLYRRVTYSCAETRCAETCCAETRCAETRCAETRCAETCCADAITRRSPHA